jgi:phenylacetate-CoA ligase
VNWRNPVFKSIMHLAGYPVGRYLRMLRSIEYSSPEKLQEIQDRALSELLLHAYTHVPYYHEILHDTGVAANGKVDLSNFTHIPVLTKEIIRKEGRRLHSGDCGRRRTYLNSSGGSTGQPVSILQDADYQAWGFAGRFLLNLWAGKDIGETEIKLWGSERDILEGREKFSTYLRRWLFNTETLNTYRMSNDDMRHYILRLNRLKPKMIWAYTDSMFKLSKFAEKENLDVYSPGAIICTTAVLHPEIRTHIEKTFRCKVFNQYGSREVGPISAECPVRNGMHIFTPIQKVETLDSRQQPVEDEGMGDLVITNLRNYSMPLIRYQIGDTGRLSRSPCSCGRSFPLLKEVSGRIFSHFIKKDGSLVHAQFFVGLLFFRPWIREFKITQKKYDVIEILVAPDGNPEDKETDEIAGKIKQVMGPECQVNFVFTDAVPPSPSGKYLYTVTEVKSD